jgi:hypothetical protein
MKAVILSCSVVALAAAHGAPQQTTRASPSGVPLSLVVTYSDGKTTTRVLTPRGGSWTPTFPRSAKPPTYDGLPLAALKVDHVVDGDVTVTVSLMYGRPHQRTVHIATVKLVAQEPITVNELSAYGVDPITLTLGVLPAAPLVQPTAGSASAMLDVVVDLVDHDAPVYKVTFRNRSSRAITAVGYRMYRGAKEVGVGRRKTNRNTPLLEPGGQLSFTFQATGVTALGFDRFEATGVLWEDGSVEGDPELKRTEDALTAGFAQQLRRVVSLLAEKSTEDGSAPRVVTVAEIRSALEALPIEPDLAGISPGSASSIKMGCQLVKDAVLQDLADHVKSSGAGAQTSTRGWSEDARVRYKAWLARTGSR